jgi:hypothetical protein
MPTTAPPLIPPLEPPTAAAEERDGFVPADVTPVHRSLVALRVEDAGALERAGLGAASARLLAVAPLRAGAVELANTDWLPWRTTPAVEPPAREGAGFCARCGAGAVAVALLAADVRDVPTLPLVVAAAVCAGAVAADGDASAG